MSVFARFPPPTLPGEVTVSEQNCSFLSEIAYNREDGTTGHVGQWINSTYQTPGRRSNLDVHEYGDHWVRDEGRQGEKGSSSAFLASTEEEHCWKAAWRMWREEGWLEALRSLQASAGRNDAPPSLPVKLACCLVWCVDALELLYTNLTTSQYQLSAEEITSKYSSLPCWSDSVIRALALHPRLDYITVATQSDELEIRSLLESNDHKIVLRDQQQVGVSCLQWAPHCDSLLAVGAESGVLLWHVDPTSPATRFVTSWVRVETSPGHSPVSSISWSPWGNLLVSACPREASLVLWDVPMGVTTRMQRGHGVGVATVAWSPDGCRLFSGGVSAVLQVWETKTWTNECWKNFTGRCKCVCWAPDGKLLLFALEDDLSLYYLSFHGNETGSSTAIKCANLSPHPIPGGDGGEDVTVGGSVQDMVWDVTGQRLALTFTPGSAGSELVAVFRTHVGQMLLELLPVGFVRGLENEHPNIISFKKNFTAGALLAVAWSSGRISFLPMHFSDPSSSSSSAAPLSHQHAPPPCPFSMPSSNKLSLNRTPLSKMYGPAASDHQAPATLKLYSLHH